MGLLLFKGGAATRVPDSPHSLRFSRELFGAPGLWSASEGQRHGELHVESLAPRRELPAELPEVTDGQRSLERRELGARGVDLRLVLTHGERGVGARGRRGLPLRVARGAEPAAEHLAVLAVVVAEPPHVRERVAGLPVLVL